VSWCGVVWCGGALIETTAAALSVERERDAMRVLHVLKKRFYHHTFTSLIANKRTLSASFM
jgi:hypothetical protein